MKPKNFPFRKQRRQLRAYLRAHKAFDGRDRDLDWHMSWVEQPTDVRIRMGVRARADTN
jgi:hypothetical protein